tara:strand:- start:196 stop:1242 length:1047 start_codon:yes stop_codon:yes gene_type:complete
MADESGASSDGDEDDEGEDDGEDEANAERGAKATNRYTRRWLDLPPLLIPPFPPALHAAVARPRPPLHRVRQMATVRRTYLGKAYQMGGRVSRVGVRVDVSSAAAAHLATTRAADDDAAADLRPGAPKLCSSTRTAGELSLRDSVGSPADEVVSVGHLGFRVPPIADGNSWVSVRRAAILATAAASADDWATIGEALTANRAATAVSDAVASAHAHPARELAARRLIANHAKVLHDVTNPARWTNVEGKPLTQIELRRVHPDLAPHVDRCLQETARRLLSHRSELRPSHAGAAAHSDVVVAAWAATARYLDGRIQGRSEQKPGRTPDMDADAAAAMRAVLQAVGGEGH